MKYTLVLLLLVLRCPAFGQGPSDEQAVRDVVQQLFTGMQRGDSALVHATFAREVTMATVFRDKEKRPVLRRENDIKPFLNAIGTPHTGTWYEEIWNMKVQLDGDFAQVWCDYAFYIDKTFSHCGVDAFHLHRTPAGWKIFHLADTRRQTDCHIPADIQKKHQ